MNALTNSAMSTHWILMTMDTFYCHQKKNCRYFETKSLHNHSHQRSSVKLEMYQNKSLLSLRPRPHWGSLKRSTRPPTWIITYQPSGLHQWWLRFLVFKCWHVFHFVSCDENMFNSSHLYAVVWRRVEQRHRLDLMILIYCVVCPWCRWASCIMLLIQCGLVLSHLLTLLLMWEHLVCWFHVHLSLLSASLPGNLVLKTYIFRFFKNFFVQFLIQIIFSFIFFAIIYRKRCVGRMV